MPSEWVEVGNIRGPAGPPGGGGGGGGVEVIGEVPSGSINGVNKDFSTASDFVTDSLAVFLNGLRVKKTLDYIITGTNDFQMVDAPVVGDVLTVDYILIGVGVPSGEDLYIGTKARMVALPNGTRIEVQDSGGTWRAQVEYTE